MNRASQRIRCFQFRATECRRRRLLAWVVGSVLVAMLTTHGGAGSPRESCADDTAVSPGRRLRIACFNAENLAVPGERTNLTRFRFEPARRRHLEHIAAVIETLDPDIMVVSEIVSRAGVDAVVALLHEKGLADFRGYHVDGRDAFSGFDVAVIARIEPDAIDGGRIHIHAPQKKPRGKPTEADAVAGQDWRRRAYSFVDADGTTKHDEAILQRHAAAYFTVGGRRLGLLGLHLKSNPSDPGSNAQRTAETAIAREIIRREIVGRGYTPIVLGDLNDYDPDVPMADGRRRTQTTVLRDLKDFDPDSPGAELVNVAQFMPRVADRFTSHWDFNENGAPDGDDVFTMIDHVLLHRDLEPAVIRAFIDHAVGLDVSDHFPVVVDLDLARLHAE